MDFLSQFFASEQVQTAIMSAVGLILTFIISRVAAAFTAATGIKIEAAHRDALHRAVKTAVESAIKYGAKESVSTLRAHVFQHLKESVPDALKALTPGDGVLDRMIERYTFEALALLGERK